MSNDLADKIELHLTLDSPGFHLSDDDLREVVRALRGEAATPQCACMRGGYPLGNCVECDDPTARDAAQPSTDRCAKCGCETKGEMAFIDGEIWCHPCADAADEVGK